MLRRFFLLAFLYLVAAPAWAQPAAPSTPVPGAVRVSLQTSAGTIILELDAVHAPITTANFMRYVDEKRLDDGVFYRAMKIGDAGIIQGGVRDARKLLPPIAHEPTTKTGLSHIEGAVSMARGGLGTATIDFFLLAGPFPTLDARPEQTGDNQGYAVFGHVVEGMDIVRNILAAPVSPTAGEGVMRGQMLEPTIKIITARRIK